MENVKAFADAHAATIRPLVEMFNERFKAYSTAIEDNRKEAQHDLHKNNVEIDARLNEFFSTQKSAVDAIWIAVRKLTTSMQSHADMSKQLLGPDGMGSTGMIHELKVRSERTESKVDDIKIQLAAIAIERQTKSTIASSVKSAPSIILSLGGVIAMLYALVHWLQRH